MPALQIKDCPQETYEQLKLVAAEQNRSISQQMLTILQEYLAEYPVKRDALRNWDPYHLYDARGDDDGIDYAERHRRAFERLDELGHIGLPEGYTNAAQLVHEARAERC